jgi:hypothetical protein
MLARAFVRHQDHIEITATSTDPGETKQSEGVEMTIVRRVADPMAPVAGIVTMPPRLAPVPTGATAPTPAAARTG